MKFRMALTCQLGRVEAHLKSRVEAHLYIIMSICKGSPSILQSAVGIGKFHNEASVHTIIQCQNTHTVLV